MIIWGGGGCFYCKVLGGWEVLPSSTNSDPIFDQNPEQFSDLGFESCTWFLNPLPCPRKVNIIFIDHDQHIFKIIMRSISHQNVEAK